MAGKLFHRGHDLRDALIQVANQRVQRAAHEVHGCQCVIHGGIAHGGHLRIQVTGGDLQCEVVGFVQETTQSARLAPLVDAEQ